MIKPHGAEQLKPLYVDNADQRAKLREQAHDIHTVTVSSATAGNAVMLGGGYFTPLPGFMNKADALMVGQSMKTSTGLFWPTPVLNLLHSADGIEVGQSIALKDPNVDGQPLLAIQKVEAVETFSVDEIEQLVAAVYGTTDRDHPGVAEFVAQGNVIISGPIQTLNFSYFDTEFPDTFRTAVQIRDEIAERGWNRIVAFQTRNPMHRAHEELCRMAMERLDADGLGYSHVAG